MLNLALTGKFANPYTCLNLMGQK